ncbi:MAG: DUF4105 domain-containing protein [Myxococcota bacterium]
MPVPRAAALIATILVTAAADVRAAEPTIAADALVERARGRGLSRDPTWLRLGHWRTGGADGWTSEADGDAFFLSEEGRTDPAAELNATLRALADPPSPDAEKPPPACRFPARHLWLRRALDLPPEALPRPECPGLEHFLETVNARAVRLVFSAYYMSNPASAFGHTFLRLVRSDRAEDDERRGLLDYGVDYSADVDTSNGLAYAFRGVSGGFRGTFKRMPFYYKVREYSDFESRDLWEFELDLSDAEREMLLAHLWELGHTWFEYFYASENCAWHIMALVDVALPDRDLIGDMRRPVLPVDTLRVLERQDGLIRAVHYRPSLRSRLEERAEGLDGEHRTLASTLVRDPEAPIPEGWPRETRAQVLDAALDLVAVRYSEALMVREEGAKNLEHRLLARRAALGLPSEDLHVEIPNRRQPHAGHGSRRVGLGLGMGERGRPFQLLDVRFALHDLADPPAGYPELSQLELLPLRFGYSPDRDAQLEDFELDFQLFRARSLSPWRPFGRPVAWKGNVGVTTLSDPGCHDCIAAEMGAGGGWALAFLDQALSVFLTVDARFAVGGPDLDGLGRSPVRLGLGPWGGVRVRWSQDLVTLVTGEWIWLPGQTPTGLWEAEGVVRWQVHDGFALSLEGRVGQRLARASLLGMVYY